MADQNNDLPEGTDKIIEGASLTTTDTGSLSTGPTPGAATGASPGGGGEEALIALDTRDAATETSTPTRTGSSGASGESSGGLRERFRSGGSQLSGQAADRARGLVGQGLERSSEALSNVSRMIGDTAAGIDERLGEEYGDYARRAAQAIEDAATSLASKDADELIDDTRTFVRKSPGVALAGAAVVGFALARLVKSGLTGSDGESRRSSDA